MQHTEPIFPEIKAHPEPDIERWLREVVVPLCLKSESDPSLGDTLEVVFDRLMAELADGE